MIRFMDPTSVPVREGARAMRGSWRARLAIPILLAVACSEPEAPSIEPAALQAQRKSVEAPLVIDVRSAEEFAAGHIPGAVNIPFDQVADRISEIDAPNGVALYCMVGPRARKGEQALLEAGYGDILHIKGGLAAWLRAGLSVETGP